MAGNAKTQIRGHGFSPDQIADVVDKRLQVDASAVIVGGTDINIIEVGGTPVGGSSVPVNDAGGSLTVDGTVSTNQLTDATLLAQQGAVAALFKGRPPLFARRANPFDAEVVAVDNEWSEARVDQFGIQWVRPVELKSVFSNSDKGKPITVTVASTNIHFVDADTIDFVTMWASNTGTADLTLTLEWGTTTASRNLQFFIPCGQTVLVMNETPLEDEEQISGKTSAGTVKVVGFARRGPAETAPPP